MRLRADFKIFTIKKPEKVIYDVVSNNDKWVECNENKPAKLPAAVNAYTSSTADNPEDMDQLAEDSNRFLCAKEGDHWSWAECLVPYQNTQQNTNGLKAREARESIYTLPLKKVDIVKNANN